MMTIVGAVSMRPPQAPVLSFVASEPPAEAPPSWRSVVGIRAFDRQRNQHDEQRPSRKQIKVEAGKAENAVRRVEDAEERRCEEKHPSRNSATSRSWVSPGRDMVHSLFCPS